MAVSRTYTSGEDRHAPIEGAQAFTRYCRFRLGVEVPVNSSRGKWYAELSEEMEMQGWTWDDLVTTVDYIADGRHKVRKIRGVLWFVDEARDYVSRQEVDDLQVKVAEALASETDEHWRRRLSIATGKALHRVYREWREQCMST